MTLSVEVPSYAVVLRAAGTQLGHAVLLAALANLVSHPLAFLVVVPVLEGLIGAAAALVVAEAGVITGEALALRWVVATGTAWGASFVANGASIVTGVVVGLLVR